jgi:phosphatidylinositol-3-phosphatase
MASMFTRLLSITLWAAVLLSSGNLFAQTPLPRPDHIVVVIEENHSFAQIIDSPAAPYLNTLIKTGALLTNGYAITHPSQPNYLALFAGSTEGIIANNCPLVLTVPNLRSALAQVGRSFVGYSEDLPAVGSTDCIVSSYVRKHNPWVNWQTSPLNQVPASENRPFSHFPTDFNALPTLSIIVPNQQNDMHDGNDPARIQRADEWLKAHLSRYVQWAETHNSLLIVTWDEDDKQSENHIPMIVVGPMVRRGRYDERTDHYGLVRTITDMYGAPPIGLSRQGRPIMGIWDAHSPKR